MHYQPSHHNRLGLLRLFARYCSRCVVQYRGGSRSKMEVFMASLKVLDVPLCAWNSIRLQCALGLMVMLVACNTQLPPAAIDVPDPVDQADQFPDHPTPAPIYPANWRVHCPQEYPDTQLCGFGQGSSLAEAKLQAIQSIIQEIESTASSKQRCRTVTRPAPADSRYPVAVRTHCEELVRISSNAELRGTKTEKEWHTAGPIYYAVLSYDIASLHLKSSRFFQSLGDQACSSSQAPTLWSRTRFAELVREGRDCMPRWRLHRNADSRDWQVILGSGASSRVLFLHLSDLADFLPKMRSEDLKVQLRGADTIYEKRSDYSIEVTNKFPGYLYLFHIDSYGQGVKMTVAGVDGMADPGTWVFPGQRGGEEYEIVSKRPHCAYSRDVTCTAEQEMGVELLQVSGSFQEYYVGALCEQPIEVGDFPEMGAEQLWVDDERAYNMHKLLKRISSCRAIDTAVLLVKMGAAPRQR